MRHYRLRSNPRDYETEVARQAEEIVDLITLRAHEVAYRMSRRYDKPPEEISEDIRIKIREYL